MLVVKRSGERAGQVLALIAGDEVAYVAAEDLVAARRGFMQVLADQPKDSEAAAMLRRTERMIGTRVGRRLE